MSVIAVGDVPIRMNLIKVVKLLARQVKGHFEAINFGPPGRNGLKTCYLKLSPKLDPLQVIESINVKKFGKFHPKAFMPKSVPNQVASCHGYIMREMQMKYAGLDGLKKELGENTYRKLLEEVGRAVYLRLVQILKNRAEKLNTVFLLTQAYRKKHPHFGDFQLILSTLHQIQDAEGKPRLQIQENELASVRVQTSMINNIPVEKVRELCNKYIKKITDKVLEHVKNLKMEVSPDSDPLEAAATIKVREQVVKLTPYLPDIISQVVNKQFIPEEDSSHVVLIYGEPNIPSKALCKLWLRRHRAITFSRDPNMFNQLNVRVPRDALMSLLASDGTLLGGSKLTIRSCNVPVLKISVDLYKEESKQLSDELDPMETDAVDDAEDGDEDDAEDQWTEKW